MVIKANPLILQKNPLMKIPLTLKLKANKEIRIKKMILLVEIIRRKMMIGIQEKITAEKKVRTLKAVKNPMKILKIMRNPRKMRRKQLRKNQVMEMESIQKKGVL